jgi:hypothetical protein
VRAPKSDSQVVKYKKMKLIPIKLLKDESIKNTLLNLTFENSEIDKDDYIESRILTDLRSRQLMAIEDASEMAKLYLHRPGIFEKIVQDIRHESGEDFEFQCSGVDEMKLNPKHPYEYIMMEVSYDENSGHYGMACIDHKEHTAKLYDSMVKAESDFKAPLKNLLTDRYILFVSKNHPQPTGGFVAKTYEEFKDPNYSSGIPKNLLKRAFELSQYDELSQHHFCYVESLLAMMNDMGLCHPGPGDPRDRLIFIKRVVWGLIHKYIPKRDTVQWNYFETNFRYIVETRSQLGKRLKMVRGYIQVPSNGVNITLKTLYFRDDIDESWTVKQIVDWAAQII